jgi:hypothetical protein
MSEAGSSPITPSKLKVAELRVELGNRGLSTTGLKKLLVERLENALKDEASSALDSQPNEDIKKVQEDAEYEMAVDAAKELTDPVVGNVGHEETEAEVASVKDGKDELVGTAEEVTGDLVDADLTPEAAVSGDNKVPYQVAGNENAMAVDDDDVANDQIQEDHVVLMIKNLTRPFTIQALKDLLGEHGDIVNIWTNKVKSHCVVTYSNASAALKASNAIRGLKWPEATGKTLEADAFSRDEYDRLVNEESTMTEFSSAYRKRKSLAIPQGLAQTSSGFALNASQPERERGISSSSNDHSASAAKIIAATAAASAGLKEEIPIDKLFKKTKTEPCIYYLPVSGV